MFCKLIFSNKLGFILETSLLLYFYGSDHVYMVTVTHLHPGLKICVQGRRTPFKDWLLASPANIRLGCK